MAQSKPFSLIELSALMPRLEATAEYFLKLNQEKGKRAAAATSAVPRRNAGKREPRGNAAAIEKKIIAALKDSKNGLSTVEVATKTGLRKERVFYYLKKLQVEKRARMTGMKSTARWHA